jgi:AcrR family transcriptional regulator
MKLKKQPRKTSAPSTRSRAGSGSKGAIKREEILLGVMRALVNGKLRNPPLRAIGKALDIEPAHILYYFESREDLLQAVIMRWDEIALQSRTRPRFVALSLDDFADMIAGNVDRPGIVHLYLTFAAEAVDPEHPAHEFFRRRFDVVRQGLAAAVRREQAEGAIRRDLDPDHQARLLIALADGLQLQSLVDPKVNAARDLASAIARLRARSA